MKPGPPPKPPELRLLHGDRSHRPPPRAPIVKPTAGAMRPDFLKGAALEEWDRLYPELERLGLVTVVDRADLVSYCLAWQALVQAEEVLEREGYLAAGGQGTTVQNPAFIVQTKAMEKIRQLSAEFGFSPAARARVHAPGSGDEKDDDEAFFRGPVGVVPPPAPRRGPRKKT